MTTVDLSYKNLIEIPSYLKDREDIIELNLWKKK